MTTISYEKFTSLVSAQFRRISFADRSFELCDAVALLYSLPSRYPQASPSALSSLIYKHLLNADRDYRRHNGTRTSIDPSILNIPNDESHSPFVFTTDDDIISAFSNLPRQKQGWCKRYAKKHPELYVSSLIVNL